LAKVEYSQHEILGVSMQLNYQAAGDEIIRVFDVTWRERMIYHDIIG
jgi:hypothetical protein